MGLFDAIKKLGGKVFGGVKKVREGVGKVLKPVKAVIDRGNKIIDTASKIPVIGGFVDTALNKSPIGKLRETVTEAVDAGDAFARGDDGKAINKGMAIFN